MNIYYYIVGPLAIHSKLVRLYYMYYICVIFIFGLQRRILGALRVKGYRNNLFNRNRPASGRSCIVILILIDQRYI